MCIIFTDIECKDCDYSEDFGDGVLHCMYMLDQFFNFEGDENEKECKTKV